MEGGRASQQLQKVPSSDTPPPNILPPRVRVPPKRSRRKVSEGSPVYGKAKPRPRDERKGGEKEADKTKHRAVPQTGYEGLVSAKAAAQQVAARGVNSPNCSRSKLDSITTGMCCSSRSLCSRRDETRRYEGTEERGAEQAAGGERWRAREESRLSVWLDRYREEK